MKKWVRRSFKARIFMTVLLVAMLPLIILDVIMLPLLIRHSENQLATQAQEQLYALRHQMESVFLYLDGTAQALAGNADVRQALANISVSSGTVYQALFAAAGGIQPYAQAGIFDRDGVCRYGIHGMAPLHQMDTDWGLLRAAAQAEAITYAGGEGEILLHGAIAIREASGELAGFVVLSMTKDHLDALFSSLNDTAANVLLLDSFWRPVYSSQPSMGQALIEVLRRQLLDGKSLTGGGSEFNYYVSKEDQTGFFLILQKPRIFTGAVISAFYAISIAMGALCLLLCLWGAFILSRHLSKPVNDLSRAMGQVERGDFGVQIQTDRQDELGSLSKGFNRMVLEYQANLMRSVKRQKELNDAQLRMMQAQLNPHFLYNTLDTMKWLGITHHVPQVADLSAGLATILRASISEEEMVTLEKELELVERYIGIQSIRFEDRFTCEIAVGEEFQSCLVPKLVLQPLVENAILHGVAGQEDGYIKLWAESSGDTLIVSVSDNGCGMPDDLIEKLNSQDKRIQGGHLGLYNVDSIIRLHFGAAYGISAHSGKGEGSRVSVRLPLIRKEENHAEGSGGG